MRRYRWYAAHYDTFSGEGVYGGARQVAIERLGLAPGARVLDLGCGTGLNFPGVEQLIGVSGQLVGLDLSGEMLSQAAQRVSRAGWANVVLIEGDATAPPELDALGEPFDAVLATYALSLMPNWAEAWKNAWGRLRPGGSAAIVDMQYPQTWWRRPAAQVACWVGGSRIRAHPWRALAKEAEQVETRHFADGHIVVVTGRKPVSGSSERLRGG